MAVALVKPGEVPNIKDGKELSLLAPAQVGACHMEVLRHCLAVLFPSFHGVSFRKDAVGKGITSTTTHARLVEEDVETACPLDISKACIHEFF